MSEHRPFLFILGMHRSGTSCLAGSLERCGLHLGDVRRIGHFNRRGYYELRVVERLHDTILRSNQAAWFDPPDNVRLEPGQRAQIGEIVGHLSKRRPCGVKDPRLLLLLSAWLELTPEPVGFVGTFRHPTEVAMSLAHRYHMDEDHAIDLWLHYNRVLVDLHVRRPFPIIEYELTDVDTYCRALTTVAARLGLTPSIGQLRRFVSSSLRTHVRPGGAVPAACRETFAYLRDNRAQPELVASPSPHRPRMLERLHGDLREVGFVGRRIAPQHARRATHRVVARIRRTEPSSGG